MDKYALKRANDLYQQYELAIAEANSFIAKAALQEKVENYSFFMAQHEAAMEQAESLYHDYQVAVEQLDEEEIDAIESGEYAS